MGQYTVRSATGLLACLPAARLRQSAGGKGARAGQTADSIAVGDRVRLVPGPEGLGQIVEVLPRQNKIARRSAVPMPSAHPFEQVIVANVDQVVPVFAAANPTPKWNLLDRYLALAESVELPALVCVTKADLMPADAPAGRAGAELDEALAEYGAIGYPIAVTSAVTGAGLDGLREALRGRVSVLLGKSGAGKTSLLNALEPGLGQRVAEVSRATGKGRHTTSHVELFPLAMGGAIVDTPGTREFGLWDIAPDELALYFRELRPWVGRCRFGLDCRHDEEPGCAIRQAVMRGQISPRRYQSYLRLCAEA
jgi:ribosome biogenesis GTPase